jgi:heme a synthase
LGVIAFFAVVLQGVLGGLRVVLFKDQLGIFHATLAQLFFALVCGIALFTSLWWSERRSPDRPVSEPPHRRADPEIGAPLRWLFLVTTILIFLQLVLGATMRHQHAGLAIPDFPLAHGKFWPAMDADSVARYNQQRVEVMAANPITAFQIGLQMVHRVMALVILVCASLITWRARASFNSDRHLLRRVAIFWLALIFIQAGLGAWTIWSNKAADVATMHVLVGALSLVTGTLGCIIAFRRLAEITGTKPAAASISVTPGQSFRGHPATTVNQ